MNLIPLGRISSCKNALGDVTDSPYGSNINRNKKLKILGCEGRKESETWIGINTSVKLPFNTAVFWKGFGNLPITPDRSVR